MTDPATVDLDPDLFGRDQPCFGCGQTHPTGFRLRFARAAEAVTTRFTPDVTHQGPPGLMHGGLLLTLADELGAWTIVGLLGKFGFTAQLSAKLRRPVRIGAEVAGRGVIARPGTRLVTVGVTLEQAGARVFEADLRFALLDEKGAERVLGAPLPPEWLRFCRA